MLTLSAGAVTFGREGVEQVRIHDSETVGSMLDLLRSHGYNEIDTARTYGGGSSEESLGNLGWKERGFLVGTKFYPTTASSGTGWTFADSSTHCREHLRENLFKSLKALKTEKIDLWYLHTPDRSMPYVDTLREVNNLHKKEYFNRFDISNYMSWEVAQMINL